MNKVKITVLKTTLDKELAEQYAVEGLSPVPFIKRGRYSMPIMQNPTDCAMKR